MKLERSSLFATRDTVEEAMQYVDMVIRAMPEAERLPATTAAYVLYNSVIKHYEDNFVCLNRHYSNEKEEV
jgi:hypothetical protein